MAKNDKFKILVVEDNPETLKLTKWILEQAGHTVITAVNASETLNLLDSSCPEGKVCFDNNCNTKCFDAIILDFDLPDVTGGTLGGFIRNKFKDIAIIIFTAYGRLPAIVRAANNIGASLMSKPIDPDILLGEVLAGIRKEQANREARYSPVSSSSVRHILTMSRLGREVRTS